MLIKQILPGYLMTHEELLCHREALIIFFYHIFIDSRSNLAHFTLIWFKNDLERFSSFGFSSITFTKNLTSVFKTIIALPRTKQIFV